MHSVNSNVCMVKTTRLPALELETGSGVFPPNNGSWQANKLSKPVTLNRWGIVAIEPNLGDYLDYAGIISLIKNCGREMGMTVAEPVVKQFSLQMRDLKELLLKCLDKDVKFLFIIVPASGRDYYHKIKQLAEREVGILTQCIKEQTAHKRMYIPTVRNVLLKANCKLMAINQALDNSSMPDCLKEGRADYSLLNTTHSVSILIDC